jgi:RimJ/RimL family protein N-acetyltransferase
MLLLAIDAARLNGAEEVYIHVHKDNLPARRLYDQIGFRVYILSCFAIVLKKIIWLYRPKYKLHFFYAFVDG